MPCKPGQMTADHVIKFLTYKVSDKLSSVGRAFRYYDKDGSGEIDKQELEEFLAKRYNLFLNEHEFHKLMKEIDPDRSGEIDYKEFIQFFQDKYQEEFCSGISWQVAAALRDRVKTNWGSIREAFRTMDTNNNGTVEKEEMRHVLNQWIPDMTDQKMDELWKRLDIDCNGALCYQEFADAIEPECHDLKLKPLHRPEDERSDGLDPFLVSGDPGAAGLMPGIPQKLASSTLNRLRKDPVLAEKVWKEGLIRNQPNATLFDTNPIVPQSSTSLEALAFTPRPQVCDSTKQAFERLQERQGNLAYLSKRGARGVQPCSSWDGKDEFLESETTARLTDRLKMPPYTPRDDRAPSAFESMSEWRRKNAMTVKPLKTPSQKYRTRNTHPLTFVSVPTDRVSKWQSMNPNDRTTFCSRPPLNVMKFG